MHLASSLDLKLRKLSVTLRALEEILNLFGGNDAKCQSIGLQFAMVAALLNLPSLFSVLCRKTQLDFGQVWLSLAIPASSRYFVAGRGVIT